MKKTLAWSYVVIMCIITLPIGVMLYAAVLNSVFMSSPTPRLWDYYYNFITWPLNTLK